MNGDGMACSKLSKGPILGLTKCFLEERIIFSAMSRQFVLHAKMSCPSNLEGGSTPVGRAPLPTTLRTRLTPREGKWEEEDGKEGKEAESVFSAFGIFWCNKQVCTALAKDTKKQMKGSKLPTKAV